MSLHEEMLAWYPKFNSEVEEWTVVDEQTLFILERTIRNSALYRFHFRVYGEGHKPLAISNSVTVLSDFQVWLTKG